MLILTNHKRLELLKADLTDSESLISPRKRELVIRAVSAKA